MHSLAASFATLPAAEAASKALEVALPLASGQVRVATLGHTTYPVVPDSVLAGRFDDADVAAVCDIVARFGGTIVTDVDTRQT